MAEVSDPNNFDNLSKRYEAIADSEGGKIIGSDAAKKLSKEYADNPTAMTTPIHPGASLFARKYYEYKIVRLPTGSTVFLPSGGPGSGKTAGMRNISQIARLKEKAAIVYETTLSDPGFAVAVIDKALKAKARVEIVSVNRHPAEAMRSVLERAKREGRIVTVEAHIKTHLAAIKTIIYLKKYYEGNPNVRIQVIDNTRGKGEERLVDVAFFEGLKYTDLRRRLIEIVYEYYEAGRINREVFRRTLEEGQGKYGKDDQGAAVQPDTRGSTLRGHAQDVPARLPEGNERGDRHTPGRGAEERLSSTQSGTRQKNPRNKVASEAIELLDDSTAASQKNLSLILGAARGVLRENPDITITLDDGTEVAAGAALESADAEVENAIIAAKTYRSLLMSHTGLMSSLRD